MYVQADVCFQGNNPRMRASRVELPLRVSQSVSQSVLRYRRLRIAIGAAVDCAGIIKRNRKAIHQASRANERAKKML